MIPLVGEDSMGMMAPPEDIMMDEGVVEEEFVNPLAPEEVEEVQSLVDNSPALAKFIDEIAAVDPMDYGISVMGTEMPMEGVEETPML